jgi:hypothetical protein
MSRLKAKYAVHHNTERKTFYIFDIESGSDIMGFAYATEYGRGVAYSNAARGCDDLNKQKLNDNEPNPA